MLGTDILSARQIGKTLRQKAAIHAAMTADFKPKVWEVWFAWFPVKIAVVTNVIEIHDEITVEGHTAWRWLCCVARRPINRVSLRTRNGFRILTYWYDYGPATNVLTQPKALLGRFFGHGV